MKLKVLFLILSFLTINLFSQEIIISFEGKDQTGNNSTINNVKIDNLTTGKTIIVSESSMNLNLSTVLSVDNLEVFPTHKGIENIYPNPITSKATINIYSEGNSKSLIIAYDIQGKEISRLQRKFENGNNKVEFIPANAGVYFIKFIDDGKSYYSKVISTNKQYDNASLTYIESVKKNKKGAIKKNANTFFTDGDVLKLTATSGNFKSTIYDVPKTSKTYTFSFSENFFKFDKYLVKSEYPSFVNVMFSVTDKENKGVDYLGNTDFEVLENGAKISPSESFRYVKKLNQVPSKQRTVLMLDKSFSIRNSLPTIKTAALSLINKIADNQEIAIYEFSETPILLTDFTSDKTVLEAAVNSIEVDFPTTNLYGSIITGLSKINNSYTLDGIKEGYLVVLTDGDDTQASSTLQQVISARGNKRVFMVGLGSDLNEDNLNQIAFPGNYIKATDANDLEEKFEEIRLDMLRFSNSFYWLNYMTPKRNSSNTLTVKTKENANTASNKEITSTFSASGFESVLSGVYANVEVGKKYGIEKLNLTFDGTNPILPVDLKATTFWADGVPKYTWEIDNKDDFKLTQNPDDDSKAVLEIINNTYTVGNKITLKDIENDYEKVIDVDVLTDLPVVTLDTIYVNGREFKLKGNVVYDGSSSVSQTGFRFLNTSDSRTSDNNFELLFNDVNPVTTYKLIAFAKNASGESISDVFEFRTKKDKPKFMSNFQLRDVNATSVKAFAQLKDIGGSEITERGFVWSKTPNPTINDFKKTVDLNSDLNFSSVINDFEPETKYYINSYAKNNRGISYGVETEFTTTDGSVSFQFVNNRNKTDAISAEFVARLGNSKENVIEHGFVWQKEVTPTINDSIITFKGYSVNNFIGDIKNLTPNTNYKIRAYAKTPQKVSYSEIKNFNTLSGIISFSNFSVTSLDPINGRLFGGVGIGSSGLVIDEFGFVWKKNAIPTIDDNFVKSDDISGEYLAEINDLDPDTSYTIRMYAKTNTGIQYSTFLQFKTPKLNLLFGNDRFDKITPISAKYIASILINADLDILEKGICYSISNNLPTIDDPSSIDSSPINSSLSVEINDLQPSSRYFYRPYIKTRLGINYGQVGVFDTLSEIFTGNLNFATQNELNSFPDYYKFIKGNITLGNSNGTISNISDLSSLKNIDSINGSLIIKSTSLRDFKGLENLKKVTGLALTRNHALKNVSDLQSLSKIGGLSIDFNMNLESAMFPSSILDENLTSCFISNNPKLEILPDLNAVNYISNLNVTGNPKILVLKVFDNLKRTNYLTLSNLDFITIIDFPELTEIGQEINIFGNDNLETILFSKLEKYINDINNGISTLKISSNPKLQNLNGFSNLNSFGPTFKRYTIEIKNNILLDDFCGLTNLMNTLEPPTANLSRKYLTQNNKFNPTFTAMNSGSCKE